MELFQIRYFVTVADQLSFRRAADALYVSSSTLSVQIRKLETEIGTELLRRDGHYIQLTHAGHAFLKEARQLLAQASRSIASARQAAGDTWALSIGYDVDADVGVLARMIRVFKRQCPSLQLTVRHLRTVEQLAQLKSGELHIGFIGQSAAEECEVFALHCEPFVLGMLAQHPLAHLSVVSFEALSDEPLIVNSREFVPEVFHQIELRFEQAGARLNIVNELDSTAALMSFVAEGMGCTLVPANASRISQPDIVYRPLEPPAILRTGAVAKRKDSPHTLADSFFQLATEQCAANAREQCPSDELRSPQINGAQSNTAARN